MGTTLNKVLRFFKKHEILSVVLGIFVLWIFGSIGMWIAESSNSSFQSFPHAAWNLMIYLTSGFEGDQPITPAGKIIGVIVVIMGIALVGLFTATIAAVFVEKTIRKGKGMETVKLKKHIVICGWNQKAENIIQQLHAPVVLKRKAIVVINREGSSIDVKDTDSVYDDVYFISGDPSNKKVLNRANIKDADTAIILADQRNIEHADAQSIFVALAIEAISNKVHTLIEVINSENKTHFDHTEVDECISSSQLGELIIAQAALNHGISDFFQELLTFQKDKNEVYMVKVPTNFKNRTFEEISQKILQNEMISVGIKQNNKVIANPPHDTKLSTDDEILIIAKKRPKIESYKPDN
ncbi:MAG: NAD-binding protein [Bacteroidetes bacterium]|nr:NAD-binding protein [Bacteroidota bacterium]